MDNNYLKSFYKMQEKESSKIEKNPKETESLKVPPLEGFREGQKKVFESTYIFSHSAH